MVNKTKQSYNKLIHAKVWTKQDCQRIKNALNRLRFTSVDDLTREFMIDWYERFNFANKEYSITKEHSNQGIQYLRNYCFKKSGETRKSCQLGWHAQEVVKNFKCFKFVGYYTEYNGFGDAFRHIVYRCYAKDGRWFDYCPMHWGHPLCINAGYKLKKVG
jgi:hypothetical protein